MRRTRKTGGDSAFRTVEWRDPAAMKQGDALMANPLFQVPTSGTQPPINKGAMRNFTQQFASQIIQAGPNGRPMFRMPNQSTAEQHMTKFAGVLGFQRPPAPPLVKNMFGNPVITSDPGYMGPNPGQRLVATGTSGWSFKAGRARKARRKTRKLRR
jgi:hypothetical protein